MIEPRVRSVDINKMSLTVTTLVEPVAGRVESETREYRTCGEELDECGASLSGVRPGQAVNARHLKRVPGRKRDATDSQWPTAPARYNLARLSFAPRGRTLAGRAAGRFGHRVQLTGVPTPPDPRSVVLPASPPRSRSEPTAGLNKGRLFPVP